MRMTEAFRTTGLALALGLTAGLAGPALAEGGKQHDAMKEQSSQQQSQQQASATPMVQDESDNRGTRALNLLMAKGYTEYSDFERQGKNYTATVTENGETMEVVINPDAGTITETEG